MTEANRVYTLPNDISHELQDFDNALGKLALKVIICLKAEGRDKIACEIAKEYAEWLNCADGLLGIRLVLKLKETLDTKEGEEK